jgi:predicted exporter
MTFRQRRLLGWGILLAFAALGGLWLLRLDFARKISTDVLDLIPANERVPELALIRALASETEARTMLIVVSRADGSAPPLEAAQKLATALSRSPAFARAIALGDTAWRDAIGRELFEQRFALLFPTWLAGRDEPHLSRDTAKRLRTFLETPEALALQDLIPADPLLLLPDALTRLRRGLELVQPEAKGADATNGLVWAQLAASPLTEAGQAPAFAAIEAAAAELRTGDSGLRVAFTGVNRFAAASRARIEHEVQWINTLSLVAVLAVACVFIRAVHRALHLVPVIAFAVLGAWVVTTMSFERVHVIVFVLGALLTGVAIDYGFYLFMQPPAYPDEDYWDKVRRLAKPLLASCFTTVVGFALLLFSELPMIRQLGVFVGAGLLCALGSAVIYFSTVQNCFLEPRRFRAAVARPAVTRSRSRAWMVGLWVVALVGLARIGWRDDIRELEVPAPEIQAEDARIRALFGQRAGSVVYLTYGARVEEARAAVERLERWLGDKVPVANLAAIVPTRSAWENAKRFVREQPDFPAQLRAALTAEGFTADEFERFFKGYADYAAQAATSDLTTAVQKLQTRLVGPTALLLHLGAAQNWFVSIAERAPAEPPPADTHTVQASQLQSLNRLFASYRRSALHLSLLGLALVGLGVFATYGLRDGLRIFAIPCGTCLGIFGVFGWLGQPLNLFHLLGAFLGVCLTHNYSIFSATSAYRHEPPPVSVRLSALTTASSFGVLAFSGIPVVRVLGITVASMVLAALLVIELEHLAPLARKP